MFINRTSLRSISNIARQTRTMVSYIPPAIHTSPRSVLVTLVHTRPPTPQATSAFGDLAPGNSLSLALDPCSVSRQHRADQSQSSNPVYILSATRTPIGAKDGVLASLTAPELGVVAVKSAVAKSGLPAERVEELYMGNVVQAGVGQSPARQVGIGAG